MILNQATSQVLESDGPDGPEAIEKHIAYPSPPRRTARIHTPFFF
jgi:hypothetical protein